MHQDGQFNTLCPVAEQARQIVSVIAALNANDDAQVLAGETERERLKASALDLSRRLNALEEAASHQRPASLAGVMLQIMLAFDTVEVLHDLADRKGPVAAAARQHARIGRCLYGALYGLAALSGVDPACVGGDWYMHPDLDRLGAVEAILAA